MFICDNGHEPIDMDFDHTDYYDFDIYKCPICGVTHAWPRDGYSVPDDDMEGYDDGEDDPCHEWETVSEDEYVSIQVCLYCGAERSLKLKGDEWIVHVQTPAKPGWNDDIA